MEILNYWAIFGILLFIVPYIVLCRWLGRVAAVAVVALVAKRSMEAKGRQAKK